MELVGQIGTYVPVLSNAEVPSTGSVVDLGDYFSTFSFITRVLGSILGPATLTVQASLDSSYWWDMYSVSAPFTYDYSGPANYSGQVARYLQASLSGGNITTNMYLWVGAS